MIAIDLQPSLMCTLMMVKNTSNTCGAKRESDISDSSGDEGYSTNSSLFKFFSSLTNDVKCPVCFEILDRPLMLTCLHSFCTCCLQECCNDKSITCPLCRTVTMLNEKGVQGLPINRDLKNICENVKKAFDLCPKFCDHCVEKKVTRKCETCKVHLCKSCCDKLHPDRSKSHTIIVSDGTDTQEDFDVDTFTPNEFDPPIYLPFNVTRKRCANIFREWIKSLWFAPSDLNQNLSMRYIKPVYLPYWIFEAHTQTRYGATFSAPNSPIKNSVNSYSNFDKLWTTKETVFSNRYHHATIANSSLIERDLLIQVQSWELSNIPSIENSSPPLAKTLSLPFLCDETTAWRRSGEVKVMLKDKELCESRIRDSCTSTTVIKDRFVDTAIVKVASQRVFLPVYFVKYVYNNQSYSVIINAQNSKVAGNRPYAAGIGGIFKMFKTS
ncbi:hypothetical protein SAMD00019534_075840, partial [Acytostelium subglobosum LB1]|uniref:hypothetical protein n=1 Tax=Acytostelium subglobosum LB1 TaxID=1410327 RepID=UPI000644EF7C